MSPHTKALTFAALACHVAVSAMVFMAADPDMTPTFAVMLAPCAWGLSALAACSYALDLASSLARYPRRLRR